MASPDGADDAAEVAREPAGSAGHVEHPVARGQAEQQAGDAALVGQARARATPVASAPHAGRHQRS